MWLNLYRNCKACSDNFFINKRTVDKHSSKVPSVFVSRFNVVFQISMSYSKSTFVPLGRRPLRNYFASVARQSAWLPSWASSGVLIFNNRTRYSPPSALTSIVSPSMILVTVMDSSFTTEYATAPTATAPMSETSALNTSSSEFSRLINSQEGLPGKLNGTGGEISSFFEFTVATVRAYSF